MAEAAFVRSDDFDYWMVNVRSYRDTTRYQYSHRIRRCTLDLSIATSQDLRKYFFQTHPGASNRNQEKNALVAYLDYLIDLGVRRDNPAKELPWSKEPDGMPNPIPKDKAQPLLERAFAYSDFFGAIVTVFLYTGLRLTEVCRLRWDEIQGEWAYLVQKGGQVRAVFLPEAVQKALTLLRSDENYNDGISPWVFPSPRLDSHIGRNWVWRKIRDFGVDIDCEGCRPHRLRHFFGTLVWEKTRDLVVTSKALGHKSVQNTVRYTLVQPLDVKEAVEQIRLF